MLSADNDEPYRYPDGPQGRPLWGGNRLGVGGGTSPHDQQHQGGVSLHPCVGPSVARGYSRRGFFLRLVLNLTPFPVAAARSTYVPLRTYLEHGGSVGSERVVGHHRMRSQRQIRRRIRVPPSPG